MLDNGLEGWREVSVVLRISRRKRGGWWVPAREVDTGPGVGENGRVNRGKTTQVVKEGRMVSERYLQFTLNFSRFRNRSIGEER